MARFELFRRQENLDGDDGGDGEGLSTWITGGKDKISDSGCVPTLPVSIAAANARAKTAAAASMNSSSSASAAASSSSSFCRATVSEESLGV